MEQLRYDGKVVIVTGAGGGLGAAYAKLLAARGAKVVVNDLGSSMSGDGSDSSAAEATIAEITAAGGTAIRDGGDVTDAKAMSRMVAATVAEFGRIDAVISNAGIIRTEPWDEVQRADIQRQLNVHLFGGFEVAKAAWPELVKSRGSIVFTTSAGMLGSNFIFGYSIAKASVYGLMRSLAVEGRSAGVRVNAVMPGAETRMQDTAIDAAPRSTDYLLSPANAAPLTCYLVHDQCTSSGEMYLTGRGHAARVVLASTPGVSRRETDLEWVAENFAAIEDTRELVVEKDLETHRNRVFGIWADGHDA